MQIKPWALTMLAFSWLQFTLFLLPIGIAMAMFLMSTRSERGPAASPKVFLNGNRFFGLRDKGNPSAEWPT